MTIDFKGNLHTVRGIEDLYRFIVANGESAVLIRRVLDSVLVSAECNPAYDEKFIRVVWSKPTRRYPSKPSLQLVELASWGNYYVLTKDGREVARKTLYRLKEGVDK